MMSITDSRDTIAFVIRPFVVNLRLLCENVLEYVFLEVERVNGGFLLRIIIFALMCDRPFS